MNRRAASTLLFALLALAAPASAELARTRSSPVQDYGCDPGEVLAWVDSPPRWECSESAAGGGEVSQDDATVEANSVALYDDSTGEALKGGGPTFASGVLALPATNGVGSSFTLKEDPALSGSESIVYGVADATNLAQTRDCRVDVNGKMPEGCVVHDLIEGGAGYPSPAPGLRMRASKTAGVAVFLSDLTVASQLGGFAWGFYNPASPTNEEISGYVNGGGHMFMRSSLSVSGTTSSPGHTDCQYTLPGNPTGCNIRQPIYNSADPDYQNFMIGAWSDVEGPSIVARTNDLAGSFLYGALDNSGVEMWRLAKDGSQKIKEISAPSTPESGYGALYAKSDGKIYWKGDGGTEYDLTASGGASSLAGDSGGATGGTITLAGGTTGIDTSATGSTVTFALDFTEVASAAIPGAKVDLTSMSNNIGTTGDVVADDGTFDAVVANSFSATGGNDDDYGMTLDRVVGTPSSAAADKIKIANDDNVLTSVVGSTLRYLPGILASDANFDADALMVASGTGTDMRASEVEIDTSNNVTGINDLQVLGTCTGCGGGASTFNGDSGSATGGTISLLGGSNGIDTSGSGSTVTFDFDATETNLVVGPGAAVTDFALMAWNTTSGKLAQNTVLTTSAVGTLSGIQSLVINGETTTPLRKRLVFAPVVGTPSATGMPSPSLAIVNDDGQLKRMDNSGNLRRFVFTDSATAELDRDAAFHSNNPVAGIDHSIVSDGDGETTANTGDGLCLWYAQSDAACVEDSVRDWGPADGGVASVTTKACHETVELGDLFTATCYVPNP